MRRLVAVALVTILALGGGLGYRAEVSAAGQCAGFADVDANNPACSAIAFLTTSHIITGYDTNPKTFGPNDAVQRAQMAAFLMRGLRWQGEATSPRTFTDFGALVGELQTASLTLGNKCDSASQCVARGYEPAACTARGLTPPCFGPNDSVTYAQVISFIARAFPFDRDFAWLPQPTGPLPYTGVPSVHQTDARTYTFYAGAIPDAPTSEAAWSQPAPRAWVARVLYQPVNHSPGPSPSPSTPPATGIGQVFNFTAAFDTGPFQGTVTDIQENVSLTYNGQVLHASGKFVAVFITCANVGNVPGEVGYYAFYLRDGKGRNFSLADLDRQFAAEDRFGRAIVYTTVQPSLSREHVFIFDVAPDATDYRMVPQN